MSFQMIGPRSISTKTMRIPKDIPQSITEKVRERAFLPSFSGSLTIEASLALPIFIFFAVCIVHFLLLISLQADIQIHAEEAARDIGKALYLAKDSEAEALAIANPLTIKAKIMDETLSERIDNSQIRGGASGIHTLLSGYDCESGLLSIIVTYAYDFPYLPDGIGNLDFMQKCICRAWIGRDLCEGEGSGSAHESGKDGHTVYVTPTGTAYHTSPSCPYLDLSIEAVPADHIDNMRNRSGGRYGKCSCADEHSGVYYVTGYGILYHSDLNCSNLKRTVEAVDISEAEGRHICPKCAAHGE